MFIEPLSDDLGTDNNSWDVQYGPVNITAGTVVVISIIDANSEEAWSGPVSPALFFCLEIQMIYNLNRLLSPTVTIPA